eukprot:1095246-Rhodomonas_salina.2
MDPTNPPKNSTLDCARAQSDPVRCCGFQAEGIKTAALTNNWRRDNHATFPPELLPVLRLFDVVVESARIGTFSLSSRPNLYPAPDYALPFPPVSSGITLAPPLSSSLRSPSSRVPISACRFAPHSHSFPISASVLTASLSTTQQYQPTRVLN